MDATAKTMSRTLLYTLSGGALSLFFVLAAAQQAEAAPAPGADKQKVDSGQSGRNEQTERRSRQVQAEKKASEPAEKKTAERKKVDSGQSGRNEQTERGARQARAEKKDGESKKQAEKGREAKEEGHRKAEETRDRQRVDSGPSGRNEQTERRSRQARWEGASPENKRQAELGRQAGRQAEEARRREENKSWREKVGESLRGAEEAFEKKLAEDRTWAEDQINQERNDPNKDTDITTGARRFSAGVYKSVYDNVHAAGEYMEKLERSSKGDLQAQREIEKDVSNVVDGARRTASDVWNDPRGSFDRAVDAGRKAVDNFRRAPISGTGELVGNLVGVGKVTRSAKAVTGGDGAPEPGAGRPDAPEPRASSGPPEGEGSRAPAGAADRVAPPAGTGGGADRAGAARGGPAGNAGDRSSRGATGESAGRRDDSSRRDGGREDGEESRRAVAPPANATRDSGRTADADRGGNDDNNDNGNDDSESRPDGAIPYHGGDSDFRPLPVALADQPVGPPAWTRAETVQPRSNAEILGRETNGAPRAVRWDVEPMHWADDPDSAIARYEGSAAAGVKESEKLGGRFKAETKFAVDGSASAGVNHGVLLKPLGQDVKQNPNGWGAEASAKAGFGQKGSVSFDSGADKPLRARAKADGFLGAEAKATARSNRNALMVLGELFAGAKAGLRGGFDFRGVGISGNIEGLAGVGLLGRAGIERGPDGRMHLGAHLGASAGLGGAAGFDITYDRKKGKQTAQDAAEAINRAGSRAALANAVDRADAGHRAEKRSVPVKKPNKGKHANKNKGRKG